MKSNICKIDNGIKDLELILQESEKIAQYNSLTHKQAMQLRLLCEEIDGMLPKIIGEFEGDFWIEFENNVCKMNISVEFRDFTTEKKKNLIAVSTDKKNAAVKGIVAKICSAIEDYFLNDGNYTPYDMNPSSYYLPIEHCPNGDYMYIWGLEQYKNTIIQEEQKEVWDELEKSIIASIADDVIVGVKGKKASIVIIKKFS
jgi:hypothetical protein